MTRRLRVGLLVGLLACAGAGWKWQGDADAAATPAVEPTLVYDNASFSLGGTITVLYVSPVPLRRIMVWQLVNSCASSSEFFNGNNGGVNRVSALPPGETTDGGQTSYALVRQNGGVTATLDSPNSICRAQWDGDAYGGERFYIVVPTSGSGTRRWRIWVGGEAAEGMSVNAGGTVTVEAGTSTLAVHDASPSSQAVTCGNCTGTVPVHEQGTATVTGTVTANAGTGTLAVHDASPSSQAVTCANCSGAIAVHGDSTAGAELVHVDGAGGGTSTTPETVALADGDAQRLDLVWIGVFAAIGIAVGAKLASMLWQDGRGWAGD